MSGTSSEYQRGFEDGAAKRDPVSLADARAESYRKGYDDAWMAAWRLWGRNAEGCGPTASQDPSQTPRPPKIQRPVSGQHRGSQEYRENDDGA